MKLLTKSYWKDLWYWHETACKFAIYFLIGYLIACVIAFTHWGIDSPEAVVPATLVVTAAWPLVILTAITSLLYGS